MQPKLIKGNSHKDDRGQIIFNNDFDPLEIRRLYFIENRDTDFVRAWQGHKTEQRFFTAVQGSFLIQLIKIDNWEGPNKNAEIFNFELNAASGDILHIPSGYVNSIKALEENAKLLAMADCTLAESNDDYRFPVDFFNNKNR